MRILNIALKNEALFLTFAERTKLHKAAFGSVWYAPLFYNGSSLIRYCIGLGDGAGSNVIVRFAMMHVTRCLGVILLNPTTNKVTMMENLKDRFKKWKIGHVNPTGEHVIAFRRFGHKVI